jgi:hypothetical protein
VFGFKQFNFLKNIGYGPIAILVVDIVAAIIAELTFKGAPTAGHNDIGIEVFSRMG